MVDWFVVDMFDVGRFDVEGFDVDWIGVEGFDVDRFDVKGFDVDWFDVDWVDVEGFDVDRLDVEGFDVEGLGVEGFDIDGFVVDSELLIPFVDEFDVTAVVSLVDSVAVDSDWTIRAVDNVLETEAVTSVVVSGEDDCLEDPIEGVELA